MTAEASETPAEDFAEDPASRAYRRVRMLAEGRIVEPFEVFAREGGQENGDETVLRLGASPAEVPQTVVAKGSQNVLFFGHGSKSRLSLHITGSRNIVFIGAFCDLAPTSIQILGDDCTVFVGAFTRFMPGGGIRAQGQGFSVVIGERCYLGANCVVATTDGHGIYLAKDGARLNPERDVRIGDHAFIGFDSRVQKGSVVEPDGIVLERSIVSGRVRSACVYQGIPATLREEGVSWSSHGQARTLEEAQAQDARLIAERMEILRRKGALEGALDGALDPARAAS